MAATMYGQLPIQPAPVKMAGETPVAPHHQRSEDRTDLYPHFFAKNQPYAKSGPYTTNLGPSEEREFRAWAQQHKISADDPTYDNRGFWKAMKAGDPRAKTAMNATAGEIHGPDTWKTPYDPSFSRESIYALPHAPRWQGQYLVDEKGNKLFDDKTGMRLDVAH